MHTDRQADRQKTDRQINRSTDTQTVGVRE